MALEDLSERPSETLAAFRKWALQQMRMVHHSYSPLSFLQRTECTIAGEDYRFYPQMAAFVHRLDELTQPSLAVVGSSTDREDLSALKTQSYESVASSSTDSPTIALTRGQRLTTIIDEALRLLVAGTLTDPDEKQFVKKVFARAYAMRNHGNHSTFSQLCEDFLSDTIPVLTNEQYRDYLNKAIEIKDIDCLLMLPILYPQTDNYSPQVYQALLYSRLEDRNTLQRVLLPTNQQQYHLALDNPLFLALKSGNLALFQILWGESTRQSSVFNKARQLLGYLLVPGYTTRNEYYGRKYKSYQRQVALPAFVITPEMRPAVDQILAWVVDQMFQQEAVLPADFRDHLFKQDFLFFESPIINYLTTQGCRRTSCALLYHACRHNLLPQSEKTMILYALAKKRTIGRVLGDIHKLYQMHPVDFVAQLKIKPAPYPENDYIFDLMLHAAFQRKDPQLLDFLIRCKTLTDDQLFHLFDMVHYWQSLWGIEQLLQHETIAAIPHIFEPSSFSIYIPCRQAIEASTDVSLQMAKAMLDRVGGGVTAGMVLFDLVKNLYYLYEEKSQEERTNRILARVAFIETLLQQHRQSMRTHCDLYEQHDRKRRGYMPKDPMGIDDAFVLLLQRYENQLIINDTETLSTTRRLLDAFIEAGAMVNISPNYADYWKSYHLYVAQQGSQQYSSICEFLHAVSVAHKQGNIFIVGEYELAPATSTLSRRKATNLDASMNLQTSSSSHELELASAISTQNHSTATDLDTLVSLPAPSASHQLPSDYAPLYPAIERFSTRPMVSLFVPSRDRDIVDETSLTTLGDATSSAHTAVTSSSAHAETSDVNRTTKLPEPFIVTMTHEVADEISSTTLGHSTPSAHATCESSSAPAETSTENGATKLPEPPVLSKEEEIQALLNAPPVPNTPLPTPASIMASPAVSWFNLPPVPKNAPVPPVPTTDASRDSKKPKQKIGV